MNSKKALQELMNGFGFGVIGRSLCEIISQDLERLEKLEKENKELKIENVMFKVSCDLIKKEEAKLKKVIEILNDKFDIELSDFSEYDNEENENVYLLTLESKDINCDEYCERATTSLNKEEAIKIKEWLENEL